MLRPITNQWGVMELRSIEPEKLVITQANELALAAYSTTLEEKRLILLLASMIRKDDDTMKRYRFPAVDVINFLGLGNNNDAYARIRGITRSLLSRVLDMDLGEYPPGTLDKDKEWEQFQWMAYARYIPKHKSDKGIAEIELQAHSELRPYLLELQKRFASIPFSQIAHLPSFYSIRMFEILWHSSHQLARPKVVLELEALKRFWDAITNIQTLTISNAGFWTKRRKTFQQKPYLV